MNTFKKKALLSAVVAGFGVAGTTAEAVYLNPNGLGQVLVYPYYTVQNNGTNGFNTYMSIVNTTTDAKVLKVRFREGRASQEVIDFNLYLSPNDVWTAAVVPVDATNDSAAKVITFDKSCTNPAFPAGGAIFVNYAYTGSSDDGAGTSLARTREGYIEVFEMAIVTGASQAAVTHTSSGVPANCGAVQGTTVVLSLGAPTGGLSGSGTLINVNSGADAGYVADALASFTTAAIYSDVLVTAPSMSNADPLSFTLTNGGTGYTDAWVTTTGATAGAKAVSAVYMATAVLNEYVLDTATLSGTDWVITFPTKSFFVSTTTAITPFTNLFTANGACELVSFGFFNREEAGAATPPGGFSPAPPSGPANTVCWESTVVAIGNGLAHTPGASATASGVLGSRNFRTVAVDGSFQNGWAALTFIGANASGSGLASAAGFAYNIRTGTVSAAAPHTYYGLPVTGFMVRTFNNGSVTCGTATCQANYGSLFRHAFRKNITP